MADNIFADLIPRSGAPAGPAPAQGVDNPFADLIPTPAAPQAQAQPQPAVEPERGAIIDPVMQGLTFGFADEIAGGIGGLIHAARGAGTFQEGREMTQEAARENVAGFEERNPKTALAAEIAGALPTAAIPVGAAARGAGLVNRALRGAGAGATAGAIGGAGRGEDAESRLSGAIEGAKFGGAAGGAIPVAGNLVARAIGRRSGRAAVPQNEQLKAQSQQLYQQARDAGVSIRPQSFVGMVDDLNGALRQAGLNAKQQPKSFETFRILRDARGAAQRGSRVELEDMETLRQIAGNVLRDADANERRVSGIIVNRIDDFLNGMQPRDVMAGDSKSAVNALQQARGLWRSQIKGGAIEEAMGRAQDTATGLENGLRIEFRKLLRNKRLKWTPDERKALQRVVRGTTGTNLLRFLGGFGYSPDQARSFLGTLAGIGIGGFTGGPIGAVALPAAGTAARVASRRAAGNNAEAASAVARNAGVAPFDEAAAALAAQRADQALGTGGRAATSPILDRLR